MDPSLLAGLSGAASSLRTVDDADKKDASGAHIPGQFRTIDNGGNSGVDNDNEELYTDGPEADAPPLVLLIIDYSINWYELFRKKRLSTGRRIQVEQTRWKYMDVISSHPGGAEVHLKADPNPFPFSSQKEERTVRPDFCLVRNFPTDLHDRDFVNVLIGLMFAGLPSVNSLHSVFMGMFRPLDYAAMARLGKGGTASPALRPASGNAPLATDDNGQPEGINLVPMDYYPNTSSEKVGLALEDRPEEDFPLVVKVASTHAGYGKMRAMTQDDFYDIRSILHINNEYFTTEPLVRYEYEYRIQKIAPDNYRCFKRNSDNSWKNNWNNLTFEDMECTAQHRAMIDAVSTIHGGLDLLAIDVLHQADGTEVVLENNATAMGLMWEHEEEDSRHIRNLVLLRMEEVFCGGEADQGTSTLAA